MLILIKNTEKAFQRGANIWMTMVCKQYWRSLFWNLYRKMRNANKTHHFSTSPKQCQNMNIDPSKKGYLNFWYLLPIKPVA